eukprot:1558545-Pyramimonas_sp.AAC.1
MPRTRIETRTRATTNRKKSLWRTRSNLAGTLSPHQGIASAATTPHRIARRPARPASRRKPSSM